VSVEDRWVNQRTGEHTKDYGRGMRYRVRNRGARTRSFAKKTAATAYDIEVRAELAKGLTPFDHRAGVMLFSEYVEKWLAEHHYTGTGRATVASKLNNHVLPTFAEKRLCDIRLSTIKEWWAGMRAKRTPGGQPYSASMLDTLYTIFGGILRAAVTDKLIATHPFEGWNPDLPKRDRQVRHIWEQGRVDAVLDALPERYRGVAVVSATCGHRQGESFAVALEDVNRFRNEITIRHQAIRLDRATVLAPPKNVAIRTVPLAASTLAAIDAHVASFGTTVVRCSCCGKDWHVIFTNGKGQLIKSWEFSRDVWNPTLEAVGLAGTKTNGQHNLRHFWVSMLIDGGASPKDIQAWAGHKSITTTYDTYGHLFEKSGDRARSIIDQAFVSRVYPLRTEEIN